MTTADCTRQEEAEKAGVSRAMFEQTRAQTARGTRAAATPAPAQQANPYRRECGRIQVGPEDV